MPTHDTPHDGYLDTRDAWLLTRIIELDDSLSDLGPRLHALVPRDLGDPRLAGSLMLLRITADEARVLPVQDTVFWLESLIPGGHRNDLAGAVGELRTNLTGVDDPALWSWNAEAWEELLITRWRDHRGSTVGGSVADHELVSRWGVRPNSASRSGSHLPIPGLTLPSQSLAPIRRLTDAFGKQPEPHRLLAGAVLAKNAVTEAVSDMLMMQEETLQGADHLRALSEQRLYVEQLVDWCSEQMGEGSEATDEILRQLSEVADTYVEEDLSLLAASLSACERAILDTAESPSRRYAYAYLSAFLECAVGTFDGHSQEAAFHTANGKHTWHSMSGSVPVWRHVVTNPQERAAALAFSGSAPSSVIRVHADDLVESNWLDLTLGEPRPDAEWYPSPGIQLRYASDNAADLCQLLAISESANVRLEFLEHNGNSFRRLRSLRVAIDRRSAEKWGYGALSGLRKLVPDPDALAEVIAGDEYEEDPEPDDVSVPSSPGQPSDAETPGGPGQPPRHPSASLPASLLARVKALLRQAEDPAATKAEAEAFVARATSMMAKYGIEQAMLQSSEPVTERPVDRVVDVTAPWMRECKRLLAAIAQEIRCQAVYPGGKTNRQRVHLFGFPTDLGTVEILYASLRLQMLQGAARSDAEHRPSSEDGRAYKRSWMLGFIRAVAARISQAERSARADTERDRQATEPETSPGRSVALVLADRTTTVKAHMAARYPKLAKSRPTTFKGSGYWHGHADGQRADIGDPSLNCDDEAPLLLD